MITIIHGDNIVSSRKYFVEQKASNTVIFDGEKITLTDLVQIFEGGTLFSNDRKVLIENFFLRKPSKEVEDIQSYLAKNQSDTAVVFWEKKELSKKYTSLFPKAIIKLYVFPKTVFLFLDSIQPGNGQNSIISFHKTLETSEIELIFFLLIRQFRLLLALSDNTTYAIDEVKRLAIWQKSKLEKQARFFSKEKLRKIYHKLYEIDLGSKTGSLSLTLPQSIDFLLLAI